MRLVTLDLVRFFAAAFVVLYHYTYRPQSADFSNIGMLSKFGYLGVPLFFMISGFVIALSARHRSPLQFAISRFLRLYPTLWACILFTVVISSTLAGHSYSIEQVIANFTLLNEYIGFPDIDGVYWTLKQELKFYFCIFILMVFGLFEKYRIWLTIWLLFTASHTFSGQPFFMGWFISPGYSPFFIAGIAFYLLKTEGPNRFSVAILLSSFLLGIVNSFNHVDGFVSNATLIDKTGSIIIVTGFFILMYILSSGKIELENRRLYIVLGSLTYPLYLVHNVAGNTLIEKLPGEFGPTLSVVLVTTIMLFFSWLIYELVENRLVSPVKKFSFKMISK